MLTTRLWMGSVLIALVVGMLVFDGRFEGYPFQFAFQMALAVAACHELIVLLGRERSPIVPLCYVGALSLTLFNWLFRTVKRYQPALDFTGGVLNGGADPDSRFWALIAGVSVVLFMAMFLWEMATYREGNGSFERIARTWMVVAYLGLMPAFFAQIRWLYPSDAAMGAAALALAIFVPKGCDIGAYFTGRLIGKHPMTPVLSPKKTWEGAIGGLAFAVIVAIGINRFGPAPALGTNLGIEIAFGLTVGGMGMLGDLAESLIKRDCQKKDASQAVPGFGGVLDVVDAVIFAAPVAYGWFLVLRSPVGQVS